MQTFKCRQNEGETWTAAAVYLNMLNDETTNSSTFVHDFADVPCFSLVW